MIAPGSFGVLPATRAAGWSVTLDGVNEYLDCGTASVLNFERTQAVSFLAWGWPQAGNYFMARCSGTIDTGWGFVANSTSALERITLKNSNANNCQQSANGTTQASQWQQFTVTYAGNSLGSGVKLYRNAVLQTRTSEQDTLSASIQTSANLYVGCRGGTPAAFYAGRLMQLAVVFKELSSTEVTEAYGGSSGRRVVDLTTCSFWSDVKFYMPFRSSDATGSTVADVGPNGYNGTKTNIEDADFAPVPIYHLSLYTP